MFIVMHLFQREMMMIGKYDTIDKARIAMHKDVILVMEETSQSVDWIEEVRNIVNGQQFNDDFNYYDDFDYYDNEMGINSKSAWANLRGNNYDWEIFEI